ncbi:MAG: PIN domain-containing protein [Gemmataceae bacterium]|nr:PIN domain-containing protein [Gemmataceae bacterium]
MRILLDTNILIRLANKADAQHALADRAVDELARRGETLCLTPQVLIEFRSVATRPTPRGLGLPAALADALVAGFEAKFKMLDDTAAIYPAWRLLVTTLGVLGRQVHDARLAAVCHAHGVTHILTFNFAHFNRFVAHPPGLVVVDPAAV